VKKIDRYNIVESLFESGGSTYCQAEEVLTGEVKRQVLLKVLAPWSGNDPSSPKRFADEAKLIVDLGGHPNIVSVYGMGIDDGVPWIAMEYLSDSVAQHVGEQQAPVTAIAKMIEDVCKGLSRLHGLTPPLLHNALKPQNILIDAFGNHKLMEFSSAGPMNAEPTISLSMVRYAAPELLSREFGQVSASTDLYALGHIAYEMAMGTRQHRQQFPAVFSGQTRGEVDPRLWQAWHHSTGTVPAPLHEVRKDFPHALGNVIARLMLKSPPERYPTAADVLADLRSMPMMGKAISTAAPPMVSPSRPMSKTPVAAPTPSEPVAPSRASDLPAPRSPVEMYYVRFRGRISGPYDTASIKRMIKQGLVSRLHQVSTDRVNWSGVDKVENLH
jgi:eukaryotic-like serine/threonine-protein kinase